VKHVIKGYEVRITKEALKDIRTFSPKMKKKLRDILIEVLEVNPYEGKKLVGDLAGYFSLRLDFRDRIVYNIDEEKKIVFVKRARTHYDD
jgi:Txe/YoeB family toxin of toxin-antitoxin system